MRLQLGQKQLACQVYYYYYYYYYYIISDPSAAVGNLGLGTRLMTHEQHFIFGWFLARNDVFVKPSHLAVLRSVSDVGRFLDRASQVQEGPLP